MLKSTSDPNWNLLALCKMTQSRTRYGVAVYRRSEIEFIDFQSQSHGEHVVFKGLI